MKNIIKIVCLALFLYSCGEDKLTSFKDNKTPGLYFQRDGSTYTDPSTGLVTKRNYIDSLFYNFAGSSEKVVSHVVAAPLKVIGIPYSYDRPVKFKVNKDMTTAVEGTDFVIDYDTCKIVAGKMNGAVDVKLLRTKNIKGKMLVIVLELENNGHFEPVLKEYQNTNVWNDYTTTYSGHLFRLFFTEKDIQPSYWGMVGAQDLFGPWSPEKYNAINKATGWTINDWNKAPNGPVTAGTFPYGAYKTQQYLQAEADAGHPVKEADGKFIQLMSPYLVNYSAYE